MFWLTFWKRRRQGAKKLSGNLRRHMLRYGEVSVDTLRELRQVEHDVVIGDKPLPLTMVRIFHPIVAKEKGIKINSFESLDNHPDLVLYEGHYETFDGQATNIHIAKKF
jgi:hypothetical protein